MKQLHALGWVLLAAMLVLSGTIAKAATITGTTTLTYTAGAGVNNNLSVTISGTNFVFNDSGETITTTIAGATGSGTNTVNVPGTGTVTAIILNLGDGTDTISTVGVVLNTQTLTITQTGTGGLTLSGPLTTLAQAINVNASNALTINNNINSGTGTITLMANQDGAGTDSLTQNATNTTSTITTTNTSSTALTIQVNTTGGGTGSASLRTIACSGTLTVQTFGGSMLYAGTDTLTTTGQQATTTLAPGITGPAPSANAGSAPTGTINALKYVLSASSTGTGSIGTAARPIQTSTPASNTETLSAGSGGIYFVDWGNPLTLNSATATGAGNVEVVAANASGHNLTVAGTVSTGSGNIVLAADDNFTVNSGVTIGGTVSGVAFSGNVYLACNRDNGNTETLTMSGTITTTSTSASAVVIEGFHTAGNGTDSGFVTVNNITVGNGGTITISTVPSSQSTGQGSIVATNSSSVLNAGANGTVKFIATTMAGPTTAYTAAVGLSGTPILVTAGNVIVTAKVGVVSGVTSYPASVYVTDTIAGNFTASITGSVSSTLNFATNSGALTVAGTITNSTGGAISLTGAGGVVINAPLGSSNTSSILINGNPATLNTTLVPTSTETVSVTASNGLTISPTGLLAGTAAVGNFTAVTVQSGGTISPAGLGTVGALNIGNLTIYSPCNCPRPR